MSRYGDRTSKAAHGVGSIVVDQLEGSLRALAEVPICAIRIGRWFTSVILYLHVPRAVAEECSLPADPDAVLGRDLSEHLSLDDPSADG